MRRATALSLCALLWTASSAATDGPVGGNRAAREPSDNQPALGPPLPALLPASAPGAISVGDPEAGVLLDALKMPESREWVLGDPDNAWGTEETIHALMQAIRQVRERFPDGPAAVVGSISRQFGGAFPPHRGHRTGREVDLHFYLVNRNRHGWYEPATKDNLDRARSWQLLRSVLLESPVDFVLIDRDVQLLLMEHARSVGEDEDWLRALFHGCGRTAPVIQHAPGHTGHMHIRFASPVARERGRLEYQSLVRQGRIRLAERQVKHVVSAGESLLGLANRYRTSIASIRELNGLAASALDPGLELTILERVPIPGARAPIEIRPLPQPGGKCSDRRP